MKNFYLCLKTKPFVILSGISGTGKSKIVQLFAEAMGANFKMVPVKPEWSDSTDLLGYRNISNATNDRTFVSSIIPLPNGAGHSIIYVMIDNVIHSALVQGMFSSLTFDCISKQKMGGSNMSNFITKQLPVLPPRANPLSHSMGDS